MTIPTNAPQGANAAGLPELSDTDVASSACDVGPHVAATDAFRAGYDQLNKLYVGHPYDARYGERYRELVLQLDTALSAAGPVTSAADAAALVRLEGEFFMEEHEGSELTGLSATRAAMMKGVANFLAVLAPGSVMTKADWLAACAARLAEQGYAEKWAAAHTKAVWAECLETHGSEIAVLANCPAVAAADEALEFWGTE